ncbi:MAG: type II toxin-antitoxin system VapC family toxin [Deltaproteobacteria bacterium]|nr:type II toxin-antitoxin system VapC family toxin [Deltaproteobacteria bacterium]
MTLVDTDVFIWYLRGNHSAAQALTHAGEFSTSAVTYMELVQGMRSKDELRVLRSTLHRWGSRVVPIDEAVCAKAVFYCEEHFHSGGLRLADALVAATAVVHDATLLTANARHYKMISDLVIKKFSPPQT